MCSMELWAVERAFATFKSPSRLFEVMLVDWARNKSELGTVPLTKVAKRSAAWPSSCAAAIEAVQMHTSRRWLSIGAHLTLWRTFVMLPYISQSECRRRDV